MDVTILLMKCPTTHKPYGVRIQKMSDNDWWRTWAFPLNLTQAKNEGYDETMIQGALHVTQEYPGCPYCGAKGFVQCGKCKKIVCWKKESSLTCEWCGKKMENIRIADKFDITGGQF